MTTTVTVEENNINVTLSDGVSPSSAQLALLQTLAALTGLAKFNGSGSASAIALQSFMETFLAAANAAAARTAIGAGTGNGDLLTANNLSELSATQSTARTNIGAASSSDLTTHTGLSTTAHGGILPQDAGILSKSGAYQLAAGDEGKIIECDGTFTVTLPDGLDEGFQVAIVNIGTGVITLAAATTLTTKDSAVTLADQYGGATVYRSPTTNVWRAIGDLS